jgi:hypothetical protein
MRKLSLWTATFGTCTSASLAKALIANWDACKQGYSSYCQ